MFFKVYRISIVYKKTGEWYIEQQRMTTSDNESQWVVQRITTSGTTNHNEWQRVIQRVTTNGNEWQQVVQWMTTNESEWEQVKENDFGFRMKQNMQCIITIYSAI